MEKQKEEITLRDGFNKRYTIDALPRTEIEKIIDEIYWPDAIEIAIKEHCHNYRNALLLRINIENGEIDAVCRSQNWYGANDSQYVFLMTIDQNTIHNGDYDVDDFMQYIKDEYPELYEGAKKARENDELGTFVDENNIDESEYELEAYRFNMEDFEPDMDTIVDQLDEIYNINMP